MWRVGKIALIAVPWVLLALLVWREVRQMDFFALDASTDAHALARADFFADLAYDGCIPRDAVIAAADARGWYRGALDGVSWCHAPAGLSGWLHIEVSPPLPFSTDAENAAYIGFDEQGCMARWRHTSCP
ncbi:MAG: hypothetical protein JJU08_00025 [Rhodobacteraceae bacterium]|nr:hypothetical protein [Paracoccaceae bacterium]